MEVESVPNSPEVMSANQNCSRLLSVDDKGLFTGISSDISHVKQVLTESAESNEAILEKVEAISQSSRLLAENTTQYINQGSLSQNITELNNTVNSLQESLVISNNKLVEAVSTIPVGSYGLEITSGIIGAIVAAIAVFIFNIIYFGKVNNLNKKAHFSKVALKLLEYFELSATEYWISERIKDKRKSDMNNKEMKLLEIKIKNDFSVLRTSLDSFIKVLSADECRDSERITKLLGSLYDLATGGQFESETKTVDIKTTKEISKQSAMLKSILIKYSQKIS